MTLPHAEGLPMPEPDPEWLQRYEEKMADLMDARLQRAGRAGGLLPPGPELVVANRRVMAARLDWPDGAVEACEQIDADHPGWSADYRHAYREWPAGFYAAHDNHSHLEPNLYGATPDELRAAIRAHRCRANW